MTDYILEEPAKCPNCCRKILEKTLVEHPYFHWCAGCWDWICDCRHCVEPLNIKRQPVKDVQIRSVGYDRRSGRLEIEFTWTDDVRQFYPVAPGAISAIAYNETDVLILEWNSETAGASL